MGNERFEIVVSGKGAQAAAGELAALLRDSLGAEPEVAALEEGGREGVRMGLGTAATVIGAAAAVGCFVIAFRKALLEEKGATHCKQTADRLQEWGRKRKQQGYGDAWYITKSGRAVPLDEVTVPNLLE